MKLTPTQLSQIQRWICLEKVYYSDIKAELVDHVCSKIEGNMDKGQSFEQAFAKTQNAINPRHFQMQILLATYLGMAKQLFANMLKPMILLKSTVLCATWLIILFLFEDLAPDTAVKHIKTLMISVFLGMALISFSRDLLKNSLIVVAGINFCLTLCIGQFILNMDLLIFLGLSPDSALFIITYVLSVISISGLTQVTGQYKKVRPA
jgi:hypothetical protein